MVHNCIFLPENDLKPCILHSCDRATASAVASSILRKKTQKYMGAAAGEGLYIRQEPFTKMALFIVDLKCFPMEQSLFRII